MEIFNEINWEKSHIIKCNTRIQSYNEAPKQDSSEDDDNQEITVSELKQDIEPWLSSIFQSEHFSLLLGSGFTKAITNISETYSAGMTFTDKFRRYDAEIKNFAKATAKQMGREKENIEDIIRTALELKRGEEITKSNHVVKDLDEDINNILSKFIDNILKTEDDFNKQIEEDDNKSKEALRYLKSFLISFASRTASRERLNIFTTNYERFIEYGADYAGLLLIDRFLGKINPIFRSTKLELDYHYNPPGIRGEPRYVEGVIKYTKLHGSIDWNFQNNKIIKNQLPFGGNKEQKIEKPTDYFVIYPNSDKDIETSYYPYSELFRDFSSSVCRPNSAIVTYGYGFGDSHINRIISDMLTIPSTHLVIIAFDKYNEKNETFGEARERIKQFYENHNKSQISLFIGEHLGDIQNLVDNYLPKAAIDRLQEKAYNYKEKHYGPQKNDMNYGRQSS